MRFICLKTITIAFFVGEVPAYIHVCVVVGGGGVELEGDGKVYVHHKPMGEVKVAR